MATIAGQTGCFTLLELEFFAIEDNSAFNQAIETCAGLGPGGQLAVIQNEQVLQDILSPLQQSSSGNTHWIGLRATIDPKQDPFNFKNIDGSDNPFTGGVSTGEFPWSNAGDTPQPNTVNNNDDTCAFIDSREASLLNDDVNCDRNRKFICQATCFAAQETADPTPQPTTNPTEATNSPTKHPTNNPTISPTPDLTAAETIFPTTSPTLELTLSPTKFQNSGEEDSEVGNMFLVLIALVSILLLASAFVLIRARRKLRRVKLALFNVYNWDKANWNQ